MKFSKSICLCLAFVVVAGCGGGRTKKKQTSKKVDVKAEALPPEVVESVFRSLVVSSEPTDYAKSVGQLNSFASSSEEIKASLSPRAREAVANLGGFDVAALEQNSFSTSDLDCVVDVKTLTQASRNLKQADELATARKTFGWVVRHLQLNAPEATPAAGISLLLLSGRGTPQDRAWTFLEMLRIQGMDGAVVEGLGPAIAVAFVRKEKGAPAAYAFDCEAGTAVPNKTGDGVATLKELLADVSLLPSAAKKSSTIRLLAPFDPAALSPRLGTLEDALTGEERLSLRADLARWRDSTAASGDVKRALWDWPRQRRQAFTGTARGEAWGAVNPYWKKSAESPMRELIAGDADSAAKKLIKLDFEKSVDQFAIDLRAPNLTNDQIALWAARTRQDVIYFGGVGQFERSDSNSAVAHAWFERYLKQFAAPEFSPENIVGAARMSLLAFMQGTQTTTGPGLAAWARANDAERKTIESCARDAAKLASLTGQQAEAVDKRIGDLLARIEEMAVNPLSDADRQANKEDPRLPEMQGRMKSVGDEFATSPSEFGERLLKEHVASLNRKAHDSFRIPPGVKEQLEAVKVLSQRVGAARRAEADRANEAKQVLVQLLLHLQNDAKLGASPNFAAARSSLSAEELAALPNQDARGKEARRTLVAVAFGPELLTNPSTQVAWVSGAVRNLALCRLVQNKRDAALEALKTSHPALLPIQRRELDAWARLVEKHPGWKFD